MPNFDAGHYLLTMLAPVKLGMSTVAGKPGFSYRQTVLDAFAQVADALHALGHDAEGLQAAVESRQAAAESLHLAQVSYGAGLAAFVDVWAADVQLHEADIGYLQAVAQRYQDTVALFVALGGGWWNEARVTPAAPP